MPDPDLFNDFIRAQAKALRAKDEPPANRREWEARRAALREAIFAAMGPVPEKPCPLEPRELGVLKRDGYRVERLVFQSRPNVWVTASAYVPQPLPAKKVPAVLVVHGHWAGARRDPVVQARCLGLVKLGFFVLAVDAFGAGERYTVPARGTYHGALYGSTLWPAGYTLLGMQVYDNRRAVDYLQSRPEVDGTKLGVTGASGGGNQTMYAGALDERFAAAVPVCSVGNYQAYLRAACCVCEVLPGALRFTEEGDVLGLVAPRALLVISASRDAYQFSPGQAEKSVARAERIFKLYGAGEKLRHRVFDSTHAYNQPMREAMYGWMTLFLKGQGKGEPIPEPKHEVETPEALACFPDPADRPKGFLFPPTFAAAEARALLAKVDRLAPDHPQQWQATAMTLREDLRKQLGEMPAPPRPTVRTGDAQTADGVTTVPIVLTGEGGLPLPARLRGLAGGLAKAPPCLLLHPEGKDAALQHPFAAALVKKGWGVLAVDLRGTGETRPKGDAIAGAPDHNSAEHSLWIGRPLLGQWACDVRLLLDWLAAQPNPAKRLALVGLGAAGVTALVGAALFPERITSVAAIGAPATLVTESAYAAGTPMGILAPGLLKVADVRHLAALAAPRKLVIADATFPQGGRMRDRELQQAFGFTKGVYKAMRAADRLTLATEVRMEELADAL